MDGRGRLAQPLTRVEQTGPAQAAGTGSARPRRTAKRPTRITRFMRNWSSRMADLKPPRWAGAAATALLILASIGYGAWKGGHFPMIVEALNDARDAAANAAGFRLAAVSLSGENHVSRREIFAAAGVTDRASLLFLDVDAARARLKAIPWIAEAAVRKLYPDRLQITVTERDAFALWQRDGNVSVISADGTVVGPFEDWRFGHLPLVVGAGAASRAREFLALLDGHPEIREQVRASVLVAERRWNLKLKNGLDVRLPENDVPRALDTLAELDRDKHLISRDIIAVDLRLSDRVTVQLSDAAAQAREEALKDKTAKRKRGDA
ncbi:MAG: cell division protein FtsQ/DivIB [Bradyrhizobiaceae bacterium]|nr:cell division protein FtsQ/DivIB [Bradyrhizobiaceae bacterium]